MEGGVVEEETLFSFPQQVQKRTLEVIWDLENSGLIEA